MASSKTILVDFDGVLHSYKSGWQGPDVINDPPVEGAIEFLKTVIDFGYNVCIYSSRSSQVGGIIAMQGWLTLHGLKLGYREKLSFPIEKPPAHLTIDDRAICFEGQWPTVELIDDFVPWNKREPSLFDVEV